MYVCAFHTCMYMYTCVYIFICVCVCVYVCVHACMHTHIHTYTYTNKYIHTCVHVHACMKRTHVHAHRAWEELQRDEHKGQRQCGVGPNSERETTGLKEDTSAFHFCEVSV